MYYCDALAQRQWRAQKVKMTMRCILAMKVRRRWFLLTASISCLHFRLTFRHRFSTTIRGHRVGFLELMQMAIMPGNFISHAKYARLRYALQMFYPHCNQVTRFKKQVYFSSTFQITTRHAYHFFFIVRRLYALFDAYIKDFCWHTFCYISGAIYGAMY